MRAGLTLTTTTGMLGRMSAGQAPAKRMNTGGTIRFIMKKVLIVIANSAIICSEGFIAEINNRTRL